MVLILQVSYWLTVCPGGSWSPSTCTINSWWGSGERAPQSKTQNAETAETACHVFLALISFPDESWKAVLPPGRVLVRWWGMGGALLYFTVVTLASPWCPIKNLTAGLNWPRMLPVSPESSSAEVNRSFPLCFSMVSCQACSYRHLLQWCAGADTHWLWRGDWDFQDLHEPHWHRVTGLKDQPWPECVLHGNLWKSDHGLILFSPQEATAFLIQCHQQSVELTRKWLDQGALCSSLGSSGKGAWVYDPCLLETCAQQQRTWAPEK